MLDTGKRKVADQIRKAAEFAGLLNGPGVLCGYGCPCSPILLSLINEKTAGFVPRDFHLQVRLPLRVKTLKGAKTFLYRT